MKFEFEIDGIKPVSTNDMYVPIPCKGGKKAYLTSSSELRKFHKAVEDLLQEYITDDEVIDLKEELTDRQKAIELSVVFELPSTEFFRKDTSNIVKALEDSIVNRIGVDDKRNCKVTLEKRISQDGELRMKVIFNTYELDFEIPRDW